MSSAVVADDDDDNDDYEGDYDDLLPTDRSVEANGSVQEEKKERGRIEQD